MEWIWLGLSAVPAALFVVMVVLARRAIVAAAPVVGDGEQYLNDVQRTLKMRMSELRKQATRETYRPLRWFPAVFVLFAVTLLLHVLQDSPAWDILFTIKSLLEVVLFYLVIPGAWSSVRRLFTCGSGGGRGGGRPRGGKGDSGRRKRVRLGVVTVIAPDVDYIPLEDSQQLLQGEGGDDVLFIE